MKKTLTCILIFLFIFCFGCASDRTKSSKIDNDFIGKISKQKDINVGLVFKCVHYGSTSWPGGGGLHKATSEEKKYAYDLGMKSYELIKEVINEKASFQVRVEEFRNVPSEFYVVVSPQDEWDEQRQKRHKKEMAQFLASNALNGALFVRAWYTVSGAWKKKMILDARWTMYDRNGDLTASITTISRADKAEEVFPNTLDSRYEETYLNLTKKSAENFVKALMDDN